MGSNSGASKGPSPGDTSLSNPLNTILAGPSSSDFGAGDPSSAMPGSSGPSAPTFADSVSGARTATTNITGATFDAGGPAFDPSGAGSTSAFNPATSADPSGGSSSGGGPLASISNPSGGGPVSAGVDPSGGAPLGTTGASQFTSTNDVFANPLATTAPNAFGTSPGGGTSAPTTPFGASPPVGPGAAASGGTGGAAAPAAASGGDKPGFLDQLFTGLGKSVTTNPLAFLGGAGMLFNAYQQNQALKGLPSVGASAGQIHASADQILQIAPDLRAAAQSLTTQGQQIASYLTSGTLPPGLQASLDAATKDAKTTIISNYASRGLSTDPAQNSVLAQELAAVDLKAVITTAQMGQQLLQTGVNEIGMGTQADTAAANTTLAGANLYKTLTDIDQSQQAQIQKAISGFAAAMTPTKSINIGTGTNG